MKTRLIQFSLTVIMTILITCVLSLTAYAAHIYLSIGMSSPVFSVENRQGYDIFHSSLAMWNNTDAPVSITAVGGSGNNRVLCGMFNDTFFGMYVAEQRQFLLWGKATRFRIELNRRELVSRSDTFRQSVLVHELGHALSLGDNPSSGNRSIMNHNRDRNFLAWPTIDDIDGVIQIYGRR